MLTEERDRLILSLTSTVKAVVRNFSRSYPQCPQYMLCREDFESIAWLAVVEAVDSYDPSQSSLPYFAGLVIRKRLLDFVRRVDYLGRRHRKEVRAGTALAFKHRALVDRDEERLFTVARPFEAIDARLYLDSLLRPLSARQRLILFQVYVEDRKLKDIATDLGVCLARVSQLKYQALELIAVQVRIKTNLTTNVVGV